MNKMVKSEQHLIIAICTPLMSRVHQLKHTGEMAFLDASGSLDRFNNPVYFMCTHQPAGAQPLDVWITSGQSQHVNDKAMPGKRTKCVSSTCLWWQRTKQVQIF